MPADLTGLTPYREFSRKTLEAAYPGGEAGIDQKALEAEINKQLWGTGTTAGVYSKMARRGLSEIQPETQYATSRVVNESIQDLANQYQARQIAALNASRTAELTEPAFRVTEAGVTGYYDGGTTLAREEAEARQQEAAENRKRFDMYLLSQGIGSLLQRTGILDSIFGPQSGRVGAPGGGIGVGGTGNDFGLMNLTGIPALYSFLTGNKFPGVIPTVKSGWESIFGGSSPGPTPTVPDATPYSWAWDEVSQSFIPTAAAGAGAGAAGAGFLAPGGVGAAAPSIEAGLIEMLGPELAAQLGYTGAAAGAGLAGANVGAGLTPAAIEAMTGLSTGAGTGMIVGGAGAAGASVGAGLSSLALPAAVIAGLHFLTQYIDRDTETPRVENEVGQRLSSPGEFAQVMERLNTLQIGPDGLHRQSTLLPGSGISDQLVTRVLSVDFGQQAAVIAAIDRASAPRKAAEAAVYKEAMAPGGVVPQSLAEAQGTGWNTQQWTDIFGSRP